MRSSTFPPGTTESHVVSEQDQRWESSGVSPPALPQSQPKTLSAEGKAFLQFLAEQMLKLDLQNSDLVNETKIEE